MHMLLCVYFKESRSGVCTLPLRQKVVRPLLLGELIPVLD